VLKLAVCHESGTHFSAYSGALLWRCGRGYYTPYSDRLHFGSGGRAFGEV